MLTKNLCLILLAFWNLGLATVEPGSVVNLQLNTQGCNKTCQRFAGQESYCKCNPGYENYKNITGIFVNTF